MTRLTAVLVLVVFQALIGALVPVPARTGTLALRPHTPHASVAFERAPPAIERAAEPRRESSSPPPALPASFAFLCVAAPPASGEVALRSLDTSAHEGERLTATARGPPRA